MNRKKDLRVVAVLFSVVSLTVFVFFLVFDYTFKKAINSGCAKIFDGCNECYFEDYRPRTAQGIYEIGFQHKYQGEKGAYYCQTIMCSFPSDLPRCLEHE